MVQSSGKLHKYFAQRNKKKYLREQKTMGENLEREREREPLE